MPHRHLINLVAAWGLPSLALAALHRTAFRAWSLSNAAYRRLESPARRLFKQNPRWALAACTQPATILRWFDELEREPLRPFAEANPLLPFKPLRAYGSSRWGRARKIKVLRDTYRFLELRGGPLREAVLQPGSLCILARLPLGDLGEAEIGALGFDPRFRREGELVAVLHLPALGPPLAFAALSFEEGPEGRWTGRIGCIQGRSEDGETLNKRVQKALHGLRPKAFMVAVAQEMAGALGLQALQGAGNAIQVHRRKHLIHLPWRHDLSFDYDALWTESKGRPGQEGWFELPLSPARRAAEEIKPNKRGMYARRYALLDELHQQIQAALRDPAPPSGPPQDPRP